MIDEHPQVRSPSKAIWILAYLISPALPFLCLRYARAIGLLEAFFGVIVALASHIGLVTVLSETDGSPLQIFIVLLMAISIYVVVLWQFLAGQRVGLWSESAQKQWRTAGRFFGGFLAFALILAICSFHLVRKIDPDQSRIESEAVKQVADQCTASRSLRARNDLPGHLALKR